MNTLFIICMALAGIGSLVTSLAMIRMVKALNMLTYVIHKDHQQDYIYCSNCGHKRRRDIPVCGYCGKDFTYKGGKNTDGRVKLWNEL